MSNIEINQVLRFLIVGSSTFLLDLGLLLILTKYFGVFYLISAAASFLFASLINYYLSILLVFEAGRYSSRKKELIIFFIFTFLGIIINHIIIYICSNLFILNLSMSKLISVIFVTVFNFLTKKNIVFLK